MLDMTHSYLQVLLWGRDSFLFAGVSIDGNRDEMVLSHQRLISVCNANHFYVGRDSFLFAGVSIDGN